MKPIETKWKGWRFRSRTEARWAVFLEAAGIVFEYEPEGVILPSGPYLPDFRLTEFPGSDLPADAEPEHVWLEVKGQSPTDEERERCAALSRLSGCPVLLAVGAPDFAEQIELYESTDDIGLSLVLPHIIGRLAFMNMGDPSCSVICVGRGPRDEAEEGDDLVGFADAYNLFKGKFCRVLGAKGVKFTADDTPLGLSEPMKRAYDAARSARFEFGQTDQRWPTRS